MAEAPPGPLPSLSEARGWVGHAVDDVGGAAIGQVHGFFVDAGGGEPTWLIARAGPLSAARSWRSRCATARPAAAASGSPIGREAIRSAPVVDPTRPLLREHELTICAHYGIGERVGRAAEVAARPEGAVTSQPA